MRINHRLETKLRERLTSLLLDIATLHEFQVLAEGGLGLRRKDIVVETGFEPTVGGCTCIAKLSCANCPSTLPTNCTVRSSTPGSNTCPPGLGS